MSTQYLAFNAHDPILLDGLTLPGVVTNIEVRGQYEIEKKKREGLSGSDKFGHGYNDAQITITLEVLPPDELAQIGQIEKAFKNAFGAAGKPKPIRIVNSLLDKRDITAVLFQGFSTIQGNQDDSLLCEIGLLEYEPLARKRESQQGRQVVTGPQALPTGETVGGAPKIPESDGFATGSAYSYRAANALRNSLGLPGNTPLPPELSDISSGGPSAEKFISAPQ